MSSANQQSFFTEPRPAQSLRNDRCQTILYKAVFEHFIEIKWIAALLLASKSFQNSSFGANFVVDDETIVFLESVLSPSSCFSLQFAPSLHIKQSVFDSDEISQSISNFVEELVKTNYLHLSLRSLTLQNVESEIILFFFGISSNAWPHLQDLKLENCELNDSDLEIISKNALQLRTVDLSYNAAIADSSLEHLSNLSNITSLDLSCCLMITDAGLEHISKFSHITSLNLTCCGQFTGAGLELISKLSSITSLWGSRTFTDDGLKHVSQLSGITFLNISNCNEITDAGLEHISKLSGITSLDLAGCGKITDAGLHQVSKLSRITSLDLTDCHVTYEAKSKFNTALPNCTINCE